MSRSEPASPVVLFLGDASVVDPLAHELVRAHMGSGSIDLDFEVFRFGERPVREIEGALKQVGMFTTKRCVWLRGFAEPKRRVAATESEEDADGEEEDDDGDESANPAAELLDLLQRGVPAGTLLVISAEALDARARLFKWLAANADVRDRRVPEPSRDRKKGDDELREEISRHLRDLGVERVGRGVVDEIIARAGGHIGETLQEIDRLVLSLDDPASLSVADVGRAMRDLSLGWVFDFIGAVERKNLAAAEAIVARLLSEGEHPLRLVATLGTQVATLIAARTFLDNLPRGAAKADAWDLLRTHAASLPPALRGRGAAFKLKGAANFSARELRLLHGEVRKLDLALKSSPSSPLLLFSRLLQRVCIARRAA